MLFDILESALEIKLGLAVDSR